MKLRLSLLWKILLSTSVALTLLFALTGWLVQRHVVSSTSQTLAEEVDASFRAYESLWRSRAEMLSSISLTLSNMADVRAAFSTGDKATIRDTSRELWGRLPSRTGILLVTDPRGRLIASLGGQLPGSETGDVAAVREASATFPRQASGFLTRGGKLYQVAITPVYVQANQGEGLINVLVAGYAVDRDLAAQLKSATGGSDFLFVANGAEVASTLPESATRNISSQHILPGVHTVSAGKTEYAVFSTPLLDMQGHPVGELRIFRSFAAAVERLSSLQRQIFWIWLSAFVAGLGLTYLLARRIIEPVKQLDRAAAEIGRRNYDVHISVNSTDELGRLAETFNAMSASIRQSRQELIRQERIGTIGRLSTSIVHDLRNPLAAIYGGAEMLVEGDLPPAQVKRLAVNIYRSSRHIQELLLDLVNVTRGKIDSLETCRLREVVNAAYDTLASAAASQEVRVAVNIPGEIEVQMERARMERVFANLINNALEAMPGGGSLEIGACKESGSVLLRFEDTGPGVSEHIRASLFQPFVTSGKKNGLGLGLALARQTVMDHGGEIWADSEKSGGATFFLRLPG
ncbi:MAG: integral rane sensor signal transduction histidine kinase [Bryobacterales bacterium]|nr:integral rane sensor signal transduction histidine kinase [Bryobacterales bacterium]